MNKNPSQPLVMIAAVLLSFFSFEGVAKNIPSNTYPFNDNDTVPIVLSSLNINRLVVRDDKIIGLDCPTGFCTSKGNKQDASGSITLRLNIALPFTAQVTTKNGRNFTLFITPRAIPALVSEFIGTANTRQEKSVFTRDFDYPTALTQFTKSMMLWSERGFLIDGFSLHRVDPSTLPKDTNPLAIIPQTVFVGKEYSGIIYRVLNQSSGQVTLSASQFYSYSTRSAAITKDTLLPNEDMTLYIVTGGGNHAQ